MNKSDSIKNLAQALANFNEHVGKVSKDATNPFFKSKYASLPNILEAIADPLKQAGIVFAQFPTDNNGLSTIIIHTESGEWMESTYVMPVAKQNDPQAVGSAITYARRYALSSAFGLNVDDDDDGNAASKKEDKRTTPVPVQYGPEIFKEIQLCMSNEALAKIWDKYPSLQANEEFKSKCAERKAEINTPKA